MDDGQGGRKNMDNVYVDLVYVDLAIRLTDWVNGHEFILLSNYFRALNLIMKQKNLNMEEIDQAMQEAWADFHIYRRFMLHERASFMRAIAMELNSISAEPVQTAIE